MNRLGSVALYKGDFINAEYYLNRALKSFAK